MKAKKSVTLFGLINIFKHNKHLTNQQPIYPKLQALLQLKK